MKYVIKRDDRKVRFNSSKIHDALVKAIVATGAKLSDNQIDNIEELILQKIDAKNSDSISVEEIQDLVVSSLKELNFKDLAKSYSAYRRERTKQRELKTDLMKTIDKIGIETDRDNANVGNNFSAKLLRIASESNK